MASIGDALIYGLPLLIVTLLVFGLFNELYFVSMAILVSDSYEKWNNFDGKCFRTENTTETFCKEDFGFLGMKQWIDYRDYNMVEEIFDNDPIYVWRTLD